MVLLGEKKRKERGSLRFKLGEQKKKKKGKKKGVPRMGNRDRKEKKVCASFL